MANLEMMPRAGRTALVLLAAVLLGPSLPGWSPPAAAAEPLADTSVRDVGGSRFPSGDPGNPAYVVRHDVTSTIVAGDAFPTARVDHRAHPGAFDGYWAQAGWQAAWVAPLGRWQLQPWASSVESAYLDTTLHPDAAPMQPGDFTEMAVTQASADWPLTWSRERGAPTGEPRWEIARQTRRIGASYGGSAKEIDVVFARADLVVRGGDFDARESRVTLPPLVVDLPRSYPPSARASAQVTLTAPILNYILNVEGQVLPQSGTAVFTADTRGWLPEGRETRLPSGAHLKEWHVPLNIVITITESGGALEPRLASSLGAGGAAWTVDQAGTRRIDVEPGEVLTGGVGLPTDVRQGIDPLAARSGADAGSTAAAAGSAATPVTQLDEVRQSANVDAGLSSPVDLAVAKGSYGFTVDPDHRGTGHLALRAFRNTRSGLTYFRTAAVPFVWLDGVAVALTRDRLVELRVLPYATPIGITFTGRSDGTVLDPHSHLRARHGDIHRPGLELDAVYDLGGGRFAFVEAYGEVLGEHLGMGSIGVYAEVRDLSGRSVAATPVQYMELPEPGPVIYEGESRTTEFSAPARVLDLPHARIYNGAAGGGTITVVRAGGPLTASPVADPTVSIDGQDVEVYITRAAQTADPSPGTFQAAQLQGEVPSAVPNPSPIGVPCQEPEVVDAAGDARDDLDLRRAWLETDGVNLYATVEVARLPADAVGSAAGYQLSFRYEHVGYGFVARRDVAGAWDFRFGTHPSVGSNLNPHLAIEAEIAPGSPGYIRMATPLGYGFAQGGFVSGQMLRDAGALTYDGTSLADTSPGAPQQAFGTGRDHAITYRCGSRPEATVLTLLPGDRTGQYSDIVAVGVSLTDRLGAPLAGREVRASIGTSSGTAVTNEQGRATVDVPLRDRPGAYGIEVSFAGADGEYEPSSATAPFAIEREDVAASLSLDGSGAKRTLRATLADADDDSPIAGRTVEFRADGEAIGTATTASDGRASIAVPPRYRGGPHRFEAHFAGDPWYRDAAAETT